jgi:hypothetical protein
MTTYVSTGGFNFGSAPVSTKTLVLFRSAPVEKETESYWNSVEKKTIIKISNTISTETGSTEMFASGITPGWWSEEMTAEDWEIALMPEDELLAEALALGGSWAEREDIEPMIEASRASWGNRLRELYGDDFDTIVSI